MQFRRAESLLLRVFLFSFLLPALAFLGIGWMSYDDHVSAALEQITDRAELVAEHATKIFEVQELTLQVVSDMLQPLSDDAIRTDEQAISRQLQALTRRFNQIRDVVVVDRNGHMLVTAATYPAPPTLDVTDRSYFRRFRDSPSDESYVTEALFNRLLGVPTLQLARMRKNRNTGGFDGVVLVVIGPNYFNDVYAEFADNILSTVGLVRSDGRILARYPSTATPLHEAPPAEALVANAAKSPDNGTYETASVFDSEARLVAFKRLRNYAVYATVSINRRIIRDRWLTTMSRYAVIGIPMTLLLMGLSFA